MFFGIGLPELLVLSLLGLVVFGPDRLPEMASNLASGLKSLRTMAGKAMSDLNVQSGDVAKTLSDLQSLTPRAVVGDLVSSVVQDSTISTQVSKRSRNPNVGNQPNRVDAIFDPDAT